VLEALRVYRAWERGAPEKEGLKLLVFETLSYDRAWDRGAPEKEAQAI
jgi:hypothetical protein